MQTESCHEGGAVERIAMEDMTETCLTEVGAPGAPGSTATQVVWSTGGMCAPSE